VDLSELTADGRVQFTGYLDDIRPVVAQSWACVVPLRIGGGTRLKILEAMALRTPVVSTSKGAEGLGAQDGVHLLIADEPHAFAEQVVRLLNSPELRENLAQNARQLVEEKFRWPVIEQDFCAKVEETVSRN
ncbi:MAG: glycosyltransferase, partial [Anaerolineales bacterium]|nr:glycosyltransferase [Anaerolineales bacterium]